MKILLTGSTGTVGSHVLAELVGRGLRPVALVRGGSDSPPPEGAEVVHGDLTRPETLRAAFKGIDKLYLLNAVTPDELTQALTAIDLAKAAGVKHVVYHSVYEADRFLDVPHFASKWCVEQSLKQQRIPHTVIRPNYFFQNDLAVKPALLGAGVYPMPIGAGGVSSVDVRDIAEATALALVGDDLVGESIDLVGPEAVTGPGAAATWSAVLGKDVSYGGHDMDEVEEQMVEQQGAPGWSAFDMRMMFQGYLERGFVATDAQVARLSELLGRPPRGYEAFAKEAAAAWSAEEP